ncbi:unnamed protein product [Closterium sp. Yama58-4]|nr:unnamed protein product [Closterium sp. Yama58-4]
MSHPWHHPPLFDRKNPSALRDFGRCRFVCTAAAVPLSAPSAQPPARSSSAESASASAAASISSSTASASDLIAERERRTRVRHLVSAEPALTALTEPLAAGCPARGFLPQTAVLGGSSRSEELNMDLLSSAPLEALEIGPQAYRRRVGDVYDVIPVLAIPVKAPSGWDAESVVSDSTSVAGGDDSAAAGGARNRVACWWRLVVVAADDLMATNDELLQRWFANTDNTRKFAVWVKNAHPGSKLKLHGMTIGAKERDEGKRVVADAHRSWQLQFADGYPICRCSSLPHKQQQQQQEQQKLTGGTVSKPARSAKPRSLNLGLVKPKSAGQNVRRPSFDFGSDIGMASGGMGVTGETAGSGEEQRQGGGEVKLEKKRFLGALKGIGQAKDKDGHNGKEADFGSENERLDCNGGASNDVLGNQLDLSGNQLGPTGNMNSNSGGSTVCDSAAASGSKGGKVKQRKKLFNRSRSDMGASQDLTRSGLRAWKAKGGRGEREGGGGGGVGGFRPLDIGGAGGAAAGGVPYSLSTSVLTPTLSTSSTVSPSRESPAVAPQKMRKAKSVGKALDGIESGGVGSGGVGSGGVRSSGVRSGGVAGEKEEDGISDCPSSASVLSDAATSANGFASGRRVVKLKKGGRSKSSSEGCRVVTLGEEGKGVVGKEGGREEVGQSKAFK